MDDEARLLAGAWKLDQAILGEIYDLYSPGIYRYAWRLLGNVDVAEECVAETFSRFLRALKHGVGPRGYLKAYLYRIAHNWIHDFWRNCANEVELSEIETLASKEDDLADSLAHQQSALIVRRALNELTSEQQSVIVLKYLENWDNAEIAKALNKPVGAVKALQHRALNSLRRLLSADPRLGLSDDPLLRSRQLSSLK